MGSMSADPTWFVSSSPESDQNKCEMYRYLGYHAGPEGTGLRREGKAIPLMTGTAVHEVLAKLVEQRISKPGPKVAELLEVQREKYWAEVEESGFQDEEETVKIFLEQMTLLEGLTYGWLRTCAEGFYARFEPIMIEQEMPIELPWAEEGMRLIRGCKPDLGCLRKSDGKYGVWNWKTSADERYMLGVASAPQVQMEALAFSQYLGKPVEWFGLYGLIKGSRNKAKMPGDKGREYSGPVQQQSALCYAFHRREIPGFQEEDLQPLWDYTGKDGKPHTLGKIYLEAPKVLVSSKLDMEEWVYNRVPQQTLNKLFIEMGPYVTDSYRVEQYLRQLAGNEKRWIERLREVNAKEGELGWGNPEFQAFLDATFSRDYSTCENLYHRDCPMRGLCEKRQGWEKLEGFVSREPHYETERELMEEQG